jgi:hypothetical protein
MPRMPGSNDDMTALSMDDPGSDAPEAEDPAPLAPQGPAIASPAIASSRREVVRARALKAMGWGTAAAVVTGGAAAALTSSALGLLFVLIFAGTAVAGLAAAFGGRARGPSAPGSLRRRGDSLVIDRAGEEQSIPLGDLEQGWLEEAAGSAGSDGFEVVLRRRSRHEVHVQVASRAEGEALLRAAGVGAGERVLRVPLRSQAATRRGGELMGVIGMVVLLPYVFVSGGGLVAFMLLYLKYGKPFEDGGALAMLVGLLVAMNAFALLGVGWLARYLRRREAIVGTDGVAIEGYGRRVFLPFARVRGVARDPAGVRLYLRDGLSVLLPTIPTRLMLPTAWTGIPEARAPLPVTPPPPGAPPSCPPAVAARGPRYQERYLADVALREALLARIEQAIGARGRSRVANVQLEQLDRGKRSLRAWREDLRKLLSAGGSSYRGPALGPDQLAEVVEDAAAAPERRVAAAIAVAGSGDGEARRRVRIAVEACADQDLKEALAQAAEGEIEEGGLRRAVLRIDRPR